MEDESKELQGIYRAAGEQLEEEYYFKTLQMVQDLGSPALIDGSVAFEAWKGIAQAMADASGYRVVLQAARMEEIKCTPGTFRVCENVEIAHADPTLFRTPAP